MNVRRGWRALAAEALLLLTAAIWGFAFVAQREGMEHVGPFLFNALRFSLGCLPLVPFILRARAAPRLPTDPGTSRRPSQWGVVPLGILLGLLLFGGASLQQVGLQFTTVAKSGFITGLYVVLVPLFGAVIGVRVGLRPWVGAGVAAAGLWLLTFGVSSATNSNPRAAPNLGDALMLACAAFWALHILAVDRWARRHPWPQLATTQFLTCATLSLGVAALTEPLRWVDIAAALGPVLYAGLLSVGVGYTLQVVAQRDAPAAPAAVIMSLETVFAALGGWWLLSEAPGPWALAGCGLMLSGMILAAVRR